VRGQNSRTTDRTGQMRWHRERRSGGATFVVVMQAADVRDWDDRAAAWWLSHPRDRRIFVKREVSPPLVIVNEVVLQVAAQRAFVPDDDVIEALTPKGADHAFHERILPGRTGRRQYVVDAHLLDRTARIQPVDRITIPDHEPRRSVPRPGLTELLRRPCRRGMCRDVHMDDAASVVRQHHEHEQHTEGGRGDVKSRSKRGLRRDW
jgi:hypothetical protein